jgi:5-methylcytosine-specific restriction endonuclease McrBC regulatory subunit McrC
VIFERFLLRTLKDRFYGTQISVEYQNYQKDVLVNGAGKSYQSTRPDFLLMGEGLPITVMEAKFKPRYVSLVEGKKFSRENKVSEDDIYQMLFYIQRAERGSDSKYSKGMIVAPRLDDSAAIPDIVDRTIQWLHPEEATISINVLYVDLLGTIRAICDNAPFPVDDISLFCDKLKDVASKRIWNPALSA